MDCLGGVVLEGGLLIQITPHMRILLAVEAVDFRKGIDGLAALCRQVLESDPLDGTLFVFCGRSRRAIKCLVYDGQGFWLCQKRLSQGRFAAWPMAASASSRPVDPHQLQALLWNGDPGANNAAPMWRPVAVVGVLSNNRKNCPEKSSVPPAPI